MGEPKIVDIYQSRSFSKESIDKYEALQTYRDQGLVILTATRGMIPIKVVRSWDRLKFPMNQKRAKIDAISMEVGDAYNWLVKQAITNPTTKDWPLLLFLEEDNIIPEDAYMDLHAALCKCPDCGKEVSGEEWRCKSGHKGYDGVSGLYWTKCEPSYPMAFGNPKNGPDDFRTRSVKQAVQRKSVIEVNGLAQGCALFRKDLFRRVSEPWFLTVDASDDHKAFTQDLWFAKKAKQEADARFGLHCGVQVGHLDVATGTVW